MTKPWASDIEWQAETLYLNPGTAHTYRCVCGWSVQTNDQVPPVIFCLECFEPVMLLAKDRKNAEL